MPKFIIQYRANNAGALQTLPEPVTARSLAGAIAQVAPALADICGETLEIVATLRAENPAPRHIKWSGYAFEFAFGANPRANRVRMTCAQAREYARAQAAEGATGCVWMKYRNHWHIVANYGHDGSVFNGAQPVVPAKPNPHEDWTFSVRNK